MATHESDFLGQGWAFPPSFSRLENQVDMVAKEEDIEQSLQILLSTSFGERFLQPTYGCDLHNYLFDSLDDSMMGYLEDLVRTAILLHEPRVKLDRIEMLHQASEGLILFEIHYWIRTTNTRTNYVYPFYLNEGTDLKR